MAPVVGVDNITNQDVSEIGCIGDQKKWLPGAVAKQKLKADTDCQGCQCQKGYETDPAIIERGFEPDIMRVFPEHGAEFQRTDAKRVLRCKDHPKPMARETPKPCTVIALFETRAFAEEIAYARNLQDNQDRENDRNKGKQANCDQAKPKAVVVALKKKHAEQNDEGKGNHRPGRTREGHENAKREQAA